MSLMNAIRRVTGGNGRLRLEDERPEDAEDEDRETGAEETREDPDAEEDEVENHAEDDPEAPDAEDDPEDPDAEDDKEESEAKKMSAAERAAFAKGRRAERRRIGTILGSKAAAANPSLAAHLAFSTSDRAGKAIGVLKAGASSQTGKLAGRMNGRPASRTGRGGEAPGAGRTAAGGWGKVLAKAGLSGKPKA